VGEEAPEISVSGVSETWGSPPQGFTGLALLDTDGSTQQRGLIPTLTLSEHRPKTAPGATSGSPKDPTALNTAGDDVVIGMISVK
jgi:hypothetical protein